MVKLKRQKVHVKKRRLQIPQRKSPIRLKTAARFLMAVMVVGLVGMGLVRLKYMFVDSDYFMVKGVEVKLYDEAGSMRKISLSEIGEE